MLHYTGSHDFGLDFVSSGVNLFQDGTILTPALSPKERVKRSQRSGKMGRCRFKGFLGNHVPAKSIPLKTAKNLADFCKILHISSL
jgi:hypothetical protein